jgi:hypothetical protein
MVDLFVVDQACFRRLWSTFLLSTNHALEGCGRPFSRRRILHGETRRFREQEIPFKMLISLWILKWGHVAQKTAAIKMQIYLTNLWICRRSWYICRLSDSLSLLATYRHCGPNYFLTLQLRPYEHIFEHLDLREKRDWKIVKVLWRYALAAWPWFRLHLCSSLRVMTSNPGWVESGCLEKMFEEGTSRDVNIYTDVHKYIHTYVHTYICRYEIECKQSTLVVVRS